MFPGVCFFSSQSILFNGTVQYMLCYFIPVAPKLELSTVFKKVCEAIIFRLT